jgi:hypothetical protein
MTENTAFTGHLKVLRERRAYLHRMMEEQQEMPAYAFWKDEFKALDWAIDALEGVLTFPPDVQEMRRAWAERNRSFGEFDREFAQFLDFYEWSQERQAHERRWDAIA